MKRFAVIACMTFVVLSTFTSQAADDRTTGPATESRFPPLTVPKGFKATLFACDPLVEYPSVIAIGPRLGSLYVAYDYMTGLGVEIVRRDEVRLVEDTDGDGYADRSTKFAGGFNSIQGLAHHSGTVYVMHAPHLTALRDEDGDGVAEVRRDLITGIGLKPEDNRTRLHCANGVVIGHDGWLYLAIGDYGCDVPRPEGDRLLWRGGAVLRCRSDGNDLHVFSAGLRNIYDVALDDELNVLLRDNENDGGDYMIRVCHSFFGADHGYPYLYYERPDEALPPLADLGRGSSAGGACYLETAFPPAYRGSMFFCEWGRSVVSYERERSGSRFAAPDEQDFAAGAETDPYGFKPTDVIVDYDGSLLVSDWADGQRPQRGRGRIYRIEYVGEGNGTSNSTDRPSPKQVDRNEDLATLFTQLDSPSYHARVAAQEALQAGGKRESARLLDVLQEGQLGPHGRMHAMWAASKLLGADIVDNLLEVAADDPNVAVQAQAIRVIADLVDPVLVQSRLDAGTGDARRAEQLARLAKGAEPQVVLEIVVALGRLRWNVAPRWAAKNITAPDPTIEHAAMQMLRRSENWPAVLALLDEPSDSVIRGVALRALAMRHETAIADGLIDRLGKAEKPRRRREYADLLTRIYKKPKPWEYWGYRPAPRAANTVAWEKTDAIAAALNRLLAANDAAVNAAVAKQMLREEVPVELPRLIGWLAVDLSEQGVAVILDALKEHPPAKTFDVLAMIVAGKDQAAQNRLAALAALTSQQLPESVKMLKSLSRSVDDGPVLAELLRAAGRQPKAADAKLLVEKLKSPVAGVRAAALESLTAVAPKMAVAHVARYLADHDPQVRAAAARSAGSLSVASSADRLLALCSDTDDDVRRQSLVAMQKLGDARAVSAAVESLNGRPVQLAAAGYLANHGGIDQLDALVSAAERNRSTDLLLAVATALDKWRSRAKTPRARQRIEDAVAAIHGSSGVLLHWRVAAVASPVEAEEVLATFSKTGSRIDDDVSWQPLVATGGEARVELPGKKSDGSVYLAFADVALGEAADVDLLASGGGSFDVYLNGKSIHRRDMPSRYRVDSDRFSAALKKGINRILVRVEPGDEQRRFHLRFRRQSSSAEHQRLAKLLLTGRGNAARGGEIFRNAEKSQCAKCHRIGNDGARIGPDLAGIGDRFSRIHLIESILEPSRSIAPSYETISIELDSGKTLSGVKVAETASELTIGDNQGKQVVVAKAEIALQVVQTVSTMPQDLEKRLSDRDFIDLIQFLESLKKASP